MARRVLIAGNWKMNTSRNEALALATSMLKRHSSAEVDCVIFPPVIWLEAVARVLAGSSVQVGAQDCSSEARGAFTGQIAPDMVRELGNWVIVGHSERRRDAGESDQLVGRKAAAALQADLTPIMCVGESLVVSASGKAEAFVGDQVDAILAENTSTPGTDWSSPMSRSGRSVPADRLPPRTRKRWLRLFAAESGRLVRKFACCMVAALRRTMRRHTWSTRMSMDCWLGERV
ncbi:MAG: triose-phosphate isomerase [Thermomicrobiales bacterium]